METNIGKIGSWSRYVIKCSIVLLLLGCILPSSVLSLSRTYHARFKRAAYQLPDGAELLIGAVRNTFTCPGDGYYADTDNNCQLFHVCHSYQMPDGSQMMQHHSFLCGNQTVFNQLTLTCSFEDEAIPCQNAKDFYYLNRVLGFATEPFLTDQDLQSADQFIGSRRLSARNAALENDDDGPQRLRPARQGAPSALRSAAPPPPPPPPPTTTTEVPTTAASVVEEVATSAPVRFARLQTGSSPRRVVRRQRRHRRARHQQQTAAASSRLPSNAHIFITRLQKA